jgi:hypothetical protein
VALASGAVVPISQVKVGDQVQATDPATGQTSTQKVTAVWVNHDTDLMDVTVSANDVTSTIHTTQHHPFWDATRHAWVDADQLHPGDHLTTTDGTTAAPNTTAATATARPDDTTTATLDRTTGSIHTYYVVAGSTPVLVHNTNGCVGDKWTSQGNLNDHFDKHGADMGYYTKSEYDYAARDLMCECDGRRPGVKIKVDGTTRYFFDPATKEFGIADTNGIVTYYNADQAYFNGQPGTLLP